MTRAKVVVAVWAVVAASAGQQTGAPAPPAARDLFVTAGKSLVVESPVNIQRVSVGDSQKAEAIAVTPREVLVNGKTPGETSLIIWQVGGNRLLFDLRVQKSTAPVDVVRQELAKELPGQDVAVVEENGNVFLRGTVKTAAAADRAASIAGTLGKVVNLLRVNVPPVDDQILLRVRFADVDRSATQELGANLFSLGAANNLGVTTTGQFAAPKLDLQTQQVAQGGKPAAQLTLSDALNIFLFRPDLNLGATIRALQARSLLEILAEPNVLTINNRQAAFLAGGEFPVPVVQSGVGGAGAVTIQWREFGIRINFLPVVTPRGTIRLKVAPEVSSLDTAHGIVITGFSVPAIATRRVQTEIELSDGQSFAIAGLLDNRVVESWNKVPGLGDVPLIGKLFQSRSRNKTNSELLVMVTPEIIRPIPAGQPQPGVKFPSEFLSDAPTQAPRTPPISVTGPVPVVPALETVPYEQLEQPQRPNESQQTPVTPMILMPVQQPAAPNPATTVGPQPTQQNSKQ